MALKRRNESDRNLVTRKKTKKIKNSFKVSLTTAKDVFESNKMRESIEKDEDFDEDCDREQIPQDITQYVLSKKVSDDVKASVNSVKIITKSKSRTFAVKPPTSQELNALRETENLFHSNIFKLQIEEMLGGISLKSKRRKEIELWIAQIQESITSIPESDMHPISETTWLSKLKVHCPFEQDFYEATKVFKYLKPQKITTIGSWGAGLAVKGLDIDILIEIPPECWERGDHLNYNYHRKRALYLSYVAAHLLNMPTLVHEISFEALSGDVSRPILKIQPSGKLNQRVSFRIFASASADFVAIEKLLPNRNCIPGYGVKESVKKPTPLYNSSILADMRMAQLNQYAAEVLSSKKNIQDACTLLRIWLRRRQLDEVFGMFILSQFIVHLVGTRKLFSNMNVYQIVRTVWLQLSRSDWSKEGITFRQQSDTSPLLVADAHATYAVVFLESTSALNLCANVSKAAYQWLRWECTLAIGLLNKKTINSFSALFITPKPFLLTFDNVVIFHEVRLEMQKDNRQNYWPVEAEDRIHQCLVKGLDGRSRLTVCKRMPPGTWPVSVKPPDENWSLAFGFWFNPPAAWELLNKGPPADSPDSADFRAFWGEKSELRRFQDGSICEAVYWPASNWADRRLVCRQIISYLADKHLNLANKYVYLADQLDVVLTIPKLEDQRSYGTGEEATIKALEALEDLTKNLHSLENLPLPIAQAQGVAATFRHTETFPPVPEIPQGKVELFHRSKDNFIPTPKATPVYIPTLPVLLSLQTSGKWPDDLEAVRRIKSAFYIQVAEKLRILFDLNVRVFIDHVIVEHKGYIFKLLIVYHRDVALLKRIVEPNGIVKYRDNPESLLLQKDQEIAPLLTSALRALQTVQPAYSSTVRQAKRWTSSHMLLEYIEEEAVEMIVASLFIDSTIYGVPSTEVVGAKISAYDAIDWVGPLTPQTGFLRFLQLVASYDWNNQPLIINFNNDLSLEDQRGIETAILAQRAQLNSPLVLVTPYDPSGVAFTRSKPLLPVWSRLMILAQESLKVLEQQLIKCGTEKIDVCEVFRPHMEVYDCVIHLTRGNVARRLYTLDSHAIWKTKLVAHRPKKILPIYDFEPVDQLLTELRAAYADKARFFYDKYGGMHIGVMWIEKAWISSDFKVSQINGSMLATSNVAGEQQLIPNLEAICQDFLTMGKGLISSIKCGTIVYGQD